MLMKFGSVVRVETLRHLTKTTALQRKASRNKVLAAKHMASLQLLPPADGNQAKLDARNDFKSRQRGGETGRATGCRSAPMAANESVVVRLTGKQLKQLEPRSLRTRHGEGLCISYSEALTVNLCNEPPSLNASYLRYLGIIRVGMAQHSLTCHISSYR